MPRLLVCVLLLVASSGLHSAERVIYMPYPEAHITAAQWETYRDLVQDAYKASLRRFPEENLEVLHSADNKLHFAFTTPGHPAHPAWLTRRASDGSVDQIGYFVAEEGPFHELFQAYLALTNRTLESIPEDDGKP